MRYLCFQMIAGDLHNLFEVAGQRQRTAESRKCYQLRISQDILDCQCGDLRRSRTVLQVLLGEILAGLPVVDLKETDDFLLVIYYRNTHSGCDTKSFTDLRYDHGVVQSICRE